MKMKLATTFFVMGILVMPAIGFTAESDSAVSQSKEYVKDSAITAEIKAKLAGEKMSTLTQINVDTDKDGVVVLSGVAESKEAADKAHSIAHSTEGVKSVKNQIKIKKKD